MPHASLLAMTSPLLFAPAAQVVTVDTAVAAPAHAAAQAQVAEPMRLLPLSYSLAKGQAGPQPQGSASTPQDPAETGAPPGENEILVEGEYGPVEGDPVGEFNETSYRITRDLDRAITGPLAYGYRDGLPDPLRDGLGNVVRNLREPSNFLNFLLQFKIGDAVETLGRFAINSTLGVGGVFDIAGKPGIGLPYRRNGFANTLGNYGVDTGAYLYLPITGATTVRDLIGDTLDQAVLPLAIGHPFNTVEYAVPYFVVNNLDARLEVDEELTRIDATVDPYAARRDTYLYFREREIAQLKGEEPPEPPAIVREIEEGVDAADQDQPESVPADPPRISYQGTLDTPAPSPNLAITRLGQR